MKCKKHPYLGSIQTPLRDAILTKWRFRGFLGFLKLGIHVSFTSSSLWWRGKSSASRMFFFFFWVYIHDRREESTLAALSGLPVMLWAQTAQADNFDPGKLKREGREWWRCKIHESFKRETKSRICYATYIYMITWTLQEVPNGW